MIQGGGLAIISSGIGFCLQLVLSLLGALESF